MPHPGMFNVPSEGRRGELRGQASVVTHPESDLTRPSLTSVTWRRLYKPLGHSPRLSPSRAPPLERHDKGSRTRLGLLYYCNPSAWRWKTLLHLHIVLNLKFSAQPYLGHLNLHTQDTNFPVWARLESFYLAWASWDGLSRLCGNQWIKTIDQLFISNCVAQVENCLRSLKNGTLQLEKYTKHRNILNTLSQGETWRQGIV